MKKLCDLFTPSSYTLHPTAFKNSFSCETMGKTSLYVSFFNIRRVQAVRFSWCTVLNGAGERGSVKLTDYFPGDNTRSACRSFIFRFLPIRDSLFELYHENLILTENTRYNAAQNNFSQLFHRPQHFTQHC